MNALWIAIPFSLLLGGFFLVLFIKAVQKGQYDDMDTPAYKILLDEHAINTRKNDEFKK